MRSKWRGCWSPWPSDACCFWSGETGTGWPLSASIWMSIARALESPVSATACSSSLVPLSSSLCSSSGSVLPCAAAGSRTLLCSSESATGCDWDGSVSSAGSLSPAEELGADSAVALWPVLAPVGVRLTRRRCSSKGISWAELTSGRLRLRPTGMSRRGSVQHSSCVCGMAMFPKGRPVGKVGAAVRFSWPDRPSERPRGSGGGLRRAFRIPRAF